MNNNDYENIEKKNIDNKNIDELYNIEPKIITNTYYENYPVKDNLKYNKNTNLNNLDYKYNYSSNKINIKESKMNNFIKKLLILSNMEGNFVRIFGIDKLWIPILIFLKKILLENIPTLNKYIFKEKTSSLTITYTHFTSTYYNQQNNSSDYIIYKSILCYIFDKKPFGCKFTSNPGGNLMFLDQFDEIQISKKIWLSSKNTNSNTSSIYILVLSSYESDISKINDFIKHCIDKYKPQIQSESLITSGLKYYKYLALNNSTHQCMFDEYTFTQTKTFSNIFFDSKDHLLHKIKYFTSNEETYKLIGRPYSMGIMLYGKPGTGKTSCIKAIASLTQRNIIDISLKKIKTQKELNEIFYGGKINGIEMDMRKKLFVLEEFDCIIDRLKDRKLNKNENNNNENYNENILDTNKFNIERNTITDVNKQLKDNDADGVNLDSLLCLLDGTVELAGSMFIATTNYIDLIDPALIRPGRFDCCIEFDNASEEIIIQMIKHFSIKNIKMLKKNKILSKTKSSCSASSASSASSSSSLNKLNSTHIEEIKKYSTFKEKLVWSPAKISQICLFHIDSPNYYDNVINELKTQYETECELI